MIEWLSLSLWSTLVFPTPVLLPGKSHGRRSLVGYRPWGCSSWTRLSDLTLTFHFHALEKEMATYSNVFAWRIPGIGEPGGLMSMESHRVGDDWSDLAAAAACAITAESLFPCLDFVRFYLYDTGMLLTASKPTFFFSMYNSYRSISPSI